MSSHFLPQKPNLSQLQLVMSNLPPDIIADILSRLPVKQLLCFRCVSKIWRNLIDGPDFIKLHLQNSLNSNTNHYLVLKHSRLDWVSLDSLHSTSELDHPLMCYNHSVKLLGSCNGLLCICNVVEDIAFWNPSTRKHRVLPFMSLDLKRYSGSALCSACVYGFGYDFALDDYKLVRIAQFRGIKSSFCECEVKIFSLRKNCWRRIRDMPYVCRFSGTNGVFAGGALHWVVSRNVEGQDFNVVVALDLVVEDYKEVALPEFEDKNLNIEVRLLGGCLCVIANYLNGRSDVWMMKEYGVKDSWTKLFSLSQEQMIGLARSITPLCYSKGGSEVLFGQDNLSLFWYDLKHKTIKDVRIRGAPIMYNVDICLHSLVSVHMDRGNDGSTQMTEDCDKIVKRDDFLSVGFKLVL